jgi:hypothetical protein
METPAKLGVLVALVRVNWSIAMDSSNFNRPYGDNIRTVIVK